MNYDKHPKPKKERKLPPELKAAFITVGIMLGVAAFAVSFIFMVDVTNGWFAVTIPIGIIGFLLWMYVLDQIDPM